MKLVLVALSVVLGVVNSSPIPKIDASTCQVCHPLDPNRINIHLVPHSHDDVGWLKTVDEYFYGAHSEIQSAGVQYIISSTVEALKENPERRFVQVETAFFAQWWDHQTEDTQQDFINLVNEGRIEIINAAWSMNDEAGTNYHSTIDQFTLGLRVINDTVGKCGAPTIGWQIDPFGHSREQASIFRQLGYDGVFFGRIDQDDKNQRFNDKSMEVIWQGSANLQNSDLFTNVFHDTYYPPGGFCFDVNCGDPVLNDDPNSEDYNIPNRVEDFANAMFEYASRYQTNNVIVPMGGDFHYQAAHTNFINTDRLIQAFEDSEDFNLIYSTPSCYIQAVNEDAKARDIAFNLKTDDFFPYGSETHGFWAGYFTSRPNAKRSERLSNNILQVGKQVASFSKVKLDDIEPSLDNLKKAVGILQHHDAITGTAKAAVARDYARLLDRGIKTAEPTVTASLLNLLKTADSNIELDLHTCLLSNVSVCDVSSSSDRFVVALYNPLQHLVNYFVRLPVPEGANYRIIGPGGDEVDYDIIDSISTFDYLSDDLNVQPKDLVFSARLVPGFGASLFVVEKIDGQPNEVQPSPSTETSIGDPEFLGASIDPDTGLLSSVTMNGRTIDVKQELLYYQGFPGDYHDQDNAASGAYIFRPWDNSGPLSLTDRPTVTIRKGTQVEEIRQEFSDWAVQIIRIYKEAAYYIEFDWLVGPLVVDEEVGAGTEVINRITVDGFNNDNTFYTDSNGREMIRRVLNYRPDFTYNPALEPIASNYYPVTSKIVIRDNAQNLEVALLNDRAQGGSSLAPGQLELMVHRRLLKDDAKGVGEALNDQEFDQGVVARGRHFLVFGGFELATAQERILAQEKLLEPIVFVADASDYTLPELQSGLNFEFEGLTATLPENLHILTLEPWKDDTLLLRLEHYFESGDDAIYSLPVTVDLTDIFTLFTVTEIRETTLGANQWLEEFEGKPKFEWNLNIGKKSVYKNRATPRADGDLTVTLGPMQIRTFVIRVEPRV